MLFSCNYDNYSVPSNGTQLAKLCLQLVNYNIKNANIVRVELVAMHNSHIEDIKILQMYMFLSDLTISFTR